MNYTDKTKDLIIHSREEFFTKQKFEEEGRINWNTKIVKMLI